MNRGTYNLSEKVIEDIFVTDKHILSEVLSLEYSELNMLARQKSLDSGILDLLYIWKNELLLIELKVVPFYTGIIEQINGYYKDLLNLQTLNKLINTPIHKYILVPAATIDDIAFCQNYNINIIIFDIKLVLSRYYENFKGLTNFLNLQSGDFGVVRLGLLNFTLKYLSQGNSIEKIAELENRNLKTIKNRLSIAMLLGLISKANNLYFLTEFGTKFVDFIDNIDDRLNERQKELLVEFINSNPFYSSVTYTIFSIVESVFTLSKSNYPVPREMLVDYFIKSVGKTTEWNAKKSRETATYIFSNYAIELDLLSKVDNEFYITPYGIKSVLLMQLHRSIKLIENNKI